MRDDNRGSVKRLGGVTGVILAGGLSVRMGSNKALLPYRGGRFVEAIHRQLAELCDELLVVTNTPEQYGFLPCRKVTDIYPGIGAFAGLHAGLYHSRTPHIFAVACDMPYLNSALIARLLSLRDEGEVVIPEGDKGQEPLHAVYARKCLGPMERALQTGSRRIVSFFPSVRVCRLLSRDVAELDPGFRSFENINTPEEYYQLRDQERLASLPQAATARPTAVSRQPAKVTAATQV